MRLHRYTTTLTPEESRAWEQYKTARDEHDIIQASQLQNQLRSKFKAIRHLDTRWPDNFIDPEDIPSKESIDDECEKYLNTLNKASDERPMQRYFTENPHIIGSLMVGTNSGHHATYVFPEFSLGNQLRPDFVISGKGSQGYLWINVELQSPQGNILNKDGSPGPQAREGLLQIQDWRDWYRENLSYARNTLHMDGIHVGRNRYVLIIGRRKNFDDKANAWRDKVTADNPWIEIMSYDRLFDLMIRPMHTGYF